VFQKELQNGIPNVTLWGVLQKCLHLKVYKQFIVQPYFAGAAISVARFLPQIPGRDMH
jgi:hypothetical protein